MDPGSGNLLGLVAVAVGTAALVVAVLVIVGFAILARRSRGGIDQVGRELQTKAGSLLVRLDDELRASEDEVGFAIAQFGSERTRPYSEAVAAARADLAEAFRLRQLLDDADEDSDRQRREWTLQIIANCERAQRRLGEQRTGFEELRRAEVGAAGRLEQLRSQLAAARSRIEPARASVDDLRRRFAEQRSAGVAENPDLARRLLDQAGVELDSAAPKVSGHGVSAVTDLLREASQLIHRADGLLDRVEETAAELVHAQVTLGELIRTTRLELEQARPQREEAPDPAGETIIRAMTELDRVVAAAASTNDPVEELERIGDASSALDLALAGARNQQQRLAHARDALAGAILSARSQIAEARSVMGRAGVDARTRLAEAERQLALALAESDPVEALDTARRAITLARDADALARYAAR